MISLGGFKNAEFARYIQETEREIKGYVEVTYTNSKAKENAEILSDLPLLEIGGRRLDGTQVYDNDKIGINYGTLEKDYFKLDGSFVLPNNVLIENPSMGLISDMTYENELSPADTPITIRTQWGNLAPTDGLTLYFKNNIPTDLEIFINSGDGTGPTGQQTFYTKDMTISDNGIVNLTFEPRRINFARIYIKGVVHPEWRIRLEEIDFGVSYLYEGNDLISFKTVEEVDRFNDTMPINSCEVVVGNLNSKFNYDNPNGITKFLNDGVEIKPYVGVKTRNCGVVYCPKGVYWLKEWDSNKTEATLKGQDIFCKLQDKDFHKGPIEGNDINGYLNEKRLNWGVTIINYHDDPSIGNNEYIIDHFSLVSTKAITLQKMGLYCGGIFNATRYGEIQYFDDNYRTFITTTAKQIDFNVMVNYPKVIATNPISNINVNGYLINEDSTGLNKEVLYDERFNKTGILKLNIDLNGYCEVDAPILNNCTIIEDNFGGYPRTQNSYIYLKLQCNGAGSIKLEGYKLNRSKIDNKKIINETGTQLTIDNDLISTNMSTAPDYLLEETNRVMNYNLKYRPKYKIELEYNGDPRVEAGDYLQVKNKYSNEYNTVVLTKIESTYKGNYRERIEGDIYEEQE